MAGVDRYTPRAGRSQRGKNERNRFVIAVNEKDEIVILNRLAPFVVLTGRVAFEIEPKTSCVRLVPLLVGHLAPIWREPYDVFDAGSLNQPPAEEIAPAEGRMRLPEFYQRRDKGEQFEIVTCQAPIDPANRIILAVSVVVAILSAAQLVARENHRDALRKYQRGEQIPLLLRAQGANIGIISRSFDATVPTAVVVRAILIILEVCLIVLLVVTDEILERETIMARDEVDTGVRTPSAHLVEIAGAGQPVSEFAD